MDVHNATSSKPSNDRNSSSTRVIDMYGIFDDTAASDNNTRKSARIDDTPVACIVSKEAFFEAKHVKNRHVCNTDDIQSNKCVFKSSTGIAHESACTLHAHLQSQYTSSSHKCCKPLSIQYRENQLNIFCFIA